MNTQINATPYGPTRELFAVDGTRVSLDARGEWQCTCTANTPGVQCAHIEQAKALRLMRGAKREDDTLELQLDAEQLLLLWRAAPGEDSSYRPIHNVAPAQRPMRHSAWTTVVAAAAIAGLSSGITYLAVGRTQPAMPAAEPVPAVLSPAPILEPTPALDTTVRFANPFDKTEVFEFPHGTTINGARQAVAELLLNRARERLATSESHQQRYGGRSENEKPARPLHLSQGS